MLEFRNLSTISMASLGNYKDKSYHQHYQEQQTNKLINQNMPNSRMKTTLKMKSPRNLKNISPIVTQRIFSFQTRSGFIFDRLWKLSQPLMDTYFSHNVATAACVYRIILYQNFGGFFGALFTLTMCRTIRRKKHNVT